MRDISGLEQAWNTIGEEGQFETRIHVKADGTLVLQESAAGDNDWHDTIEGPFDYIDGYLAGRFHGEGI